MKSNTKTTANFGLTFGSDPESFIFDTQEGKIVSAIEILERDKYNPIDLGDGVTTYYDNAMLEYTIKPAANKEEFIANFRDAIQKISNLLNKKFGGRYKLVSQASHEFEEGQLEHEEAKKIGCNPEFNADLIEQIDPPDFNGNLRSAGGHLSVGRADFKKILKNFNEDDVKTHAPLINFKSKIDMVKLLDYFVGVPFTLIDNDKSSLARRKIYGSPSSHRPKEFGIEYRVLSCLWTSSPELVSLIYDLSDHAIKQLVSNKQDQFFAFDKNMVNACIKENNKELAREILEAIKLPKNLMTKLLQLRDVKSWDLYKEWGIKNNKSVNA